MVTLRNSPRGAADVDVDVELVFARALMGRQWHSLPKTGGMRLRMLSCNNGCHGFSIFVLGAVNTSIEVCFRKRRIAVSFLEVACSCWTIAVISETRYNIEDCVSRSATNSRQTTNAQEKRREASTMFVGFYTRHLTGEGSSRISTAVVLLLKFLPRPSPLNSSQAILSSTSNLSETNQNVKLQVFLLISCSSLLTAALPTTGDAKLMRRACFFEAVDCTDGFSQVVSGPINRRQCFYDPNDVLVIVLLNHQL